MACQSVISGTFKNISRAKAREHGVTPYGSSNGGLHGMHCSGQWIMSLAWVILHGGLVCTSVLSTLCIVLRLACTSVLSTLCLVWYCHALVFLAHYVLFEISLTNFEALSIQVNALNSTCQPLTLTFHGPIKLMASSSQGAIHTSWLGRRPLSWPANLYFWKSLHFNISMWW